MTLDCTNCLTSWRLEELGEWTKFQPEDEEAYLRVAFHRSSDGNKE